MYLLALLPAPKEKKMFASSRTLVRVASSVRVSSLSGACSFRSTLH